MDPTVGLNEVDPQVVRRYASFGSDGGPRGNVPRECALVCQGDKLVARSSTEQHGRRIVSALGKGIERSCLGGCTTCKFNARGFFSIE